MTTRPRRRAKAESSLRSMLGSTAVISHGNSSQVILDAILPWMDGFEKRYHPQEHETDVVKCVCNFSCPDEEETREMVQCDQCGNWQHIPCLRIPRESIPADYFCHLCLPGNHKHLFDSTSICTTTTIRKPSRKSRSAAEAKLMVQPKRARTHSRARMTRGEVDFNDRPPSSADLDHDLKAIREKAPDQSSNDTSSTAGPAQSSYASADNSNDLDRKTHKFILDTVERTLVAEGTAEEPSSALDQMAPNPWTPLEYPSQHKPIYRINFPISKAVTSSMDTKLK